MACLEGYSEGLLDKIWLNYTKINLKKRKYRTCNVHSNYGENKKYLKNKFCFELVCNVGNRSSRQNQEFTEHGNQLVVARNINSHCRVSWKLSYPSLKLVLRRYFEDPVAFLKLGCVVQFARNVQFKDIFIMKILNTSHGLKHTVKNV